MFALQTERLTLTELTKDDAEFILELVNTPGWLQYIGDRGVKTIDDAVKYINNGPMQSYKEHGFGLWKMTRSEDKTPIGICGLIKRDTLDDVDIGFAMLPEFEKQGYAFEAAQASLLFGQNEKGVKKVVAITVEENERSIRLLEKLGLLFEKKIRLEGEEEELMLFSADLQ